MTSTSTGAELRDAAIDTVEAAEEFKGDWCEAVYGVVRQIALRNEFFTTDDVWRLIEHPRESRALGFE